MDEDRIVKEEASTVPSFLLSAEALLARADLLIDQARWPALGSASELIRMAHGLDPDSGAAHAALSRVSVTLLLRRWEEDDALIDRALESARRAVELSPGDPRAHAALAGASLLAEDVDAATDSASKAASLSRPGTPPWVGEIRAQALVAIHDAEGALEALSPLLADHPERVQTHHVAGNAWLEKGELHEALDAYSRAAILDPDFVPSRLQIAYVQDRLGRRDAATSAYKDLSERFPEEKSRIYTRMAVSLIARRAYDEALVGLEQARFKTKRGLGEGTVLFLKAACHQESGRSEKAKELYRQVIASFPDASYGTPTGGSLSAASFEALAGMALSEKSLDEAATVMEEALKSPRPSPGLHLRLGALYVEFNMTEEVLRLYERAAGTDFGADRNAQKAGILVAWARTLRDSGASPAASAKMMAALDREAAQFRERGGISDLLDAARACVLAGEVTLSIDWLRDAVKRGYRHFDWIESDPDFATVVSNPAFIALRHSVISS